MILLLTVFLLITSIVALIVGPTSINFFDLFTALSSSQNDSIVSQIIIEIRLPRILFAIAVGGGLSIAGAVFQAMLLNPLAEPYILGISSGGTFGAVLSFLLGLSFIGTQVFAFGGSILVMLLVFVLGKRFGELHPNQLLLSGVMIGAFFSAGILLMMTLLNDSLRTAVFWLIGNLSLAQRDNLIFVLPLTFIVVLILIMLSNRFNVLSMGSDSAKQLGLNVSHLKNFTYILVSLMIGTIVSVSGIIGFVGLLIPHICRIIFGTDNRIVFPASFFIGASYLTFADTIARTIAAPVEIPVGAITALIGAPVFIYLMRRKFNYN
ncbi:MAG: transport system permease protein [Ignavibacteria bacterium]|nr:MAG: transport system permease protein [Ignavibacteria bacterium]KAF0158893.1 MAG: transport system permease protein [Ignavibacteria bacterium]